MKNIVFALIMVFLTILSCGSNDNPVFEIQTEFGTIVVELYPDKAPITVANFIAYVEAGAYKNGSFHRTVTMDNQPDNDVKIEVIQGDKSSEFEENFGAIQLERTNLTGILHKDGAVSMARGGPDSATSSFFICINDQPSLDFGGNRNPDGQGFAAFGMVISGMEVVRTIQNQPYGGGTGQLLNPPVVITDIVRR